MPLAPGGLAMVRVNSPLPVLGIIYLVSVGIAALDAAKDVKLGWLTTLAWWVAVVGALGFIVWVGAKAYGAAKGAAA